jgi:hypothetical protein
MEANKSLEKSQGRRKSMEQEGAQNWENLKTDFRSKNEI